jgi:hypothetical protein
MNDPSHWSFDQDPPRDDTLARVLRAADSSAGGTVDWERLHAAIMRAAVASSGAAPGSAQRPWWDVLVQWRRFAAAASVAAMLAAGGLVWRGESGASDPDVGDAAPESVALARVVAAYPDDDVLTSLLQTARNDDLVSWGAQ